MLSRDGSVVYSPIKAATGTINGIKATQTGPHTALSLITHTEQQQLLHSDCGLRLVEQ